jgi:hypothetical protein
MYSVDIFDLHQEGAALMLYQQLEKNQTCLLCDNGLPIAKIVPLTGPETTIIVQSQRAPGELMRRMVGSALGLSTTS